MSVKLVIPDSVIGISKYIDTPKYHVYVDLPAYNGWLLHGKPVLSCHLFTDGPLERLHRLAELIHIPRFDFNNKGLVPRYDISEGSRRAACSMGAKNLQTVDQCKVSYALARRASGSDRDVNKQTGKTAPLPELWLPVKR